MLKNYIKLMRPKEYVKNLFIFLPVFFGLSLFDVSILIKLFYGFVSFSLVASGVYVFNDILDREEDRKHHKKKNRPIANGEVSVSEAYYLTTILWIIGLLSMFFVDIISFYFLLSYVVLNILYSVKLKHIPILDVFVIGVGFVIRLYVGSFISNVPLSVWIVLVTFLLALFLGFSKRRNDVLLFLENGKKTRKVVDGYNLNFLNFAIAISASITLISYIMYTIQESGSSLLFLTSIFVLGGMLRYVQLMFVKNYTKSPTQIMYKDKFIQFAVLFWMLSLVILLY